MSNESNSITAENRPKPLSGIRILDLSNVLAGPLGTYILALLGAEIIKIERPGSGDLSRKMGANADYGRKSMGVSYLATNSNKKSITLNLQTEEGRTLFRELVKTADAVFENFRPGTMDRLGLSYEALSQLKPDLVYCAVSGFGRSGPLAKRAAYDQIIQGYSGLMSLTGTPETAPTRVGVVVCDASSAITAGLATLAALVRSRSTGIGALIDVSMLESTLHMAAWIVSNYLNANHVPKPMGNENMSAAPSGTFETKDGLLNIVCNEEKQFHALCDALGRPELKTHPVFSDRHERIRSREQLRTIIAPLLMEQTAADWEDFFADRGVPAGRIYSVPEILTHPQISEREFIKELPEIPGVDGGAKVVGLGFKFDGEDLSPSTPPPVLGQHNREVLAEVGVCEDRLLALKDAGVI
ncbi:CoA transferase [Sinorhizobium medicae]|nr:CoA transferase [Sinorhizobium medicae]